jgi:mRNA interferase RelE/StbE/toxin YoeB
MYALEIKQALDKEFKKISKRNPKQFEIILKKVKEILENPEHYKNLCSPSNHLKRVHVEGSFVLVFSVDKSNNKVILEDFDHHDKIYL